MRRGCLAVAFLASTIGMSIAPIGTPTGAIGAMSSSGLVPSAFSQTGVGEPIDPPRPVPLLGRTAVGASAPSDSTGVESGPATTSRPVQAVRFSGNKTTDDALVRRTVGIELGRPASNEQVRAAVDALYGLGLFARVAVEEAPDTLGGRALVFRLDEYARLTEIEWEGNDALGDDDLAEKIELRTGQLLTQRKLWEAARAIETAYRDMGYASASVTHEVENSEDGRSQLVFRVNEGRKARITAIEFEGNAAFDDGELRKQIQLKPNSLFRRKRYTAERLREDEEKVLQFYQNRGYKDARVVSSDAIFDENHADLALRFQLEEGPFYRFGETTWSGNEAITTEVLTRVAVVRPGEPFSQEKIEETTAEAYNLYTEQGYLLQLRVEPTTQTRGDTVSVSYAIEEGASSRVNEISILGNTRTKERVIRRELKLAPGDLLRRSALMRSHRDIFALGFFEDVQVDYLPTGQGSDIDVVFKVKEKTSGTATAGAGYSSDTGLTGFIEFGHNNLFGNGQAVQVHLERGSRRETYDLSFTEPWVMGTPTSVGAQIYDTQRDQDLYTEKRRGFGINVGRPWFFRTPDYTRVSGSYSLESVKFSDFDNLSEESQAFLSSSNGTISSFSLAFSRNSTNNPFYPTAGSRTSLRSEFAGGIFGGEISFFKPVLDHRNYLVPFWTPAIMLRHRFGYLGAYSRGQGVPGNETFRLGGTRVDYLRGYPDYEVVPEENITVGSDGTLVRFPGGRVAYTFTAEYQFSIVNPVRGLFFLDAGNTWNSMRDFSLEDLKKGVGVGLRMEIPLLGPVGFDYAYGIDRGKWESHFILGPAF